MPEARMKQSICKSVPDPKSREALSKCLFACKLSFPPQRCVAASGGWPQSQVLLINAESMPYLAGVDHLCAVPLDPKRY